MRHKPTDVELTPLTPKQLEIFDKIKDGKYTYSWPRNHGKRLVYEYIKLYRKIEGTT